jgi:hypothetical protein
MRDKNTMKQSFVISMMGIQRREAPGWRSRAAHVIVETTSSKTPSKKLSRIFYEDKMKKPTSYSEYV